MSQPDDLMLPELGDTGDVDLVPAAFGGEAVEQSQRSAADLEALFDVPVTVSTVLGRARMDVGQLMKLGVGSVLELDRKVGEAVDIYVNNRLVARGEVVMVEDRLGVTMTEIIKV
jgi:flagellar motor switch protein FliN